ncbi:MAG: phosphoglycerate dehydrogenase [Candidatus Omnitrophica bacterium]|nr:phosphoglycerate dehydrogenase [Candidatus Omnitrophota bacterium]
MKIKVLATDNIESQGIEILQNAGFEVVEKGKLTEQELLDVIDNYDVLIVRSATKVTAPVIEKGKKLKIIGRAGVGLDNIDVEAATLRGIIVMNAPEGNTLSAAEHTFGLILSMARQIPAACNMVKSGKWDRKKFMGIELFGKTLGIIGLGRIGRRVAHYAKSFGMNVLAYDPYVNQEDLEKLEVSLVTLEGVCRQSDIITLHLPLTKETQNILKEQHFSMMKNGVMIVNVARGGLFDESLLERYIRNGKIRAAALDVFSKEPPDCTSLLELENVIVTPHLGASTKEAQINVAKDICQQIVDALLHKVIRNAVNVPTIDKEVISLFGGYLTLAEKLGLFLAQTVDRDIENITIEYAGEITNYDTAPLKAYFSKGFAEWFQTATYVNAPLILKERGIKLFEKKKASAKQFSNLINVEVNSNTKSISVSGTVVAGEPRIVEIDGYGVEAVPEGALIVCRNDDVPGIVGHIGTILGKKNVNIASMTMGRKIKGGPAITVLNLDQEIDEQTINEIGKFPGIRSVQLIRL